jgi:hypothetical protein
MAITTLDYVKSVIGDKASYPADDFYRCGVDLLGGCERCEATIAAYNAYPSKSGYWRCADCIGSTGYATTGEFTSQELGDYSCPGCGAPGHIIEVADGTACSLTCRQCGTSWTHLA